jgi:hypothetical protein
MRETEPNSFAGSKCMRDSLNFVESVIAGMLADMRHFHSQSLVVLQCYKYAVGDGCYGCCKRSLRGLSSLAPYVHAGHGRRMGRQNACDIGIGIPNSVR